MFPSRLELRVPRLQFFQAVANEPWNLVGWLTSMFAIFPYENANELVRHPWYVQLCEDLEAMREIADFDELYLAKDGESVAKVGCPRSEENISKAGVPAEPPTIHGPNHPEQGYLGEASLDVEFLSFDERAVRGALADCLGATRCCWRAGGLTAPAGGMNNGRHTLKMHFKVL